MCQSSNTTEFSEDEFHQIKYINLSCLGRRSAGTRILLCFTEKFALPNFTHLLPLHKPEFYLSIFKILLFPSDLQKVVHSIEILNSVHLQRKNARYF